jgi:predicted O-linked N-acetylglucosamine transferase (SPINDLY family)
VLWLLPASESGSQRLRREAEERGVASDRLVFAKRVPPEQHLARHKLADLLLDSPVRNAHTTACDALWAGVPILTLTGEAFAGRVATSILRAADIDELITETIDAYFETAVRLARNPSLLRRLREKAAASRSSPLFDTVRYTRNLESAYAAIVERHRRGDPPGPITVGQTN